jgi:opacity protein-like surface antigen
MKRLSVSILVVFLSIYLHGQQRAFMLSAGPNINYIQKHTIYTIEPTVSLSQEATLTTVARERHTPSFGYYVKAMSVHQIATDWSFQMGLTYDFIHLSRHTYYNREIRRNDLNQYLNEVIDAETDIHYLAAVAEFSYLVFKGFSLHAGLQASQRIASSSLLVIDRMQGIEGLDEPVYSNEYYRLPADKSGDGLSSMVFNYQAGITYEVYKGIGVSANYLGSFSPIYEKSNRVAGKAKFNNFSAGLTYMLR